MKLDKTTINLGAISIQGSYKDYITILEDVEDFHYMKGSCFCTKAKKTGNIIEVEFTPSATIGELKKGEKKFKPAFLYLWMNPEKHEYLTDDDGIKYENPDKKKITIPINYMAIG